MQLRPHRLIALLVVLAAGPACGPGVDLASDLEVTDVFTGYYDNGLTDRGWNHIVPSISFRLKNVSTRPVAGVQVMVSFWADGDDGELDSSQVRGIGEEALEPNAETEPILVRSTVGFNLEAPRSQLFLQTGFKDFTARLFGRRGGRIVPLGEFKLDRRLIPQMDSSSGAR